MHNFHFLGKTRRTVRVETPTDPEQLPATSSCQETFTKTPDGEMIFIKHCVPMRVLNDVLVLLNVMVVMLVCFLFRLAA